MGNVSSWNKLERTLTEMRGNIFSKQKSENKREQIGKKRRKAEQ